MRPVSRQEEKVVFERSTSVRYQIQVRGCDGVWVDAIDQWHPLEEIAVEEAKRRPDAWVRVVERIHYIDMV